MQHVWINKTAKRVALLKGGGAKVSGNNMVQKNGWRDTEIYGMIIHHVWIVRTVADDIPLGRKRRVT